MLLITDNAQKNGFIINLVKYRVSYKISTEVKYRICFLKLLTKIQSLKFNVKVSKSGFLRNLDLQIKLIFENITQTALNFPAKL